MRRFHPLRDHLWLSETLHNYGRRWGRGVVKMTASVRLGDDVLQYCRNKFGACPSVRHSPGPQSTWMTRGCMANVPINSSVGTDTLARGTGIDVARE